MWLFVNSANYLGGREIESRSQPFAERTTLTREGKNLETKNNKLKARPRTTSDARARSKIRSFRRLDPKLLSVIEKRTRFEGCGCEMWMNDH